MQSLNQKLLNMIDSKTLQDIPVYKIHKKAHAFQKSIENSIKPLDLKQISPESSNISRSSTSSETNSNFLVSPAGKSQFQTYDSCYKYPEPDQNYFKNYRMFLSKAVPVIRRRQFGLDICEKLQEPKQETPKVKKILDKHHMSDSKLRKTRNCSLPDIPIYLYQNFRFHEICKEISARRLIDQKYQTQKLENKKKLSRIIQMKKSKSPSKVLNLKAIDEENPKLLKNSFNMNPVLKHRTQVFPSINSSYKFLPARKRYQKIINPLN